MRGTGNGLWLAAGLLAAALWPGVALAASTVTGTVTFDGKAPALKPLAMDAEPVCHKMHGGKPVRERDAGPRQRQHHGEHHGLGLEGAAGRQDLPRSQDSGGSRSERLSVHAARDGNHGRAALQDPQLRRHPPQHPHASQDQPGIQPGAAGDGQGDDHVVPQAGGDVPGQVRRPPMDERLHRRPHPSLLLGDGHGREVHDRGPRRGDLRAHRLAREAGDADGLGDRQRQRYKEPRTSSSP